MLKSSVFSLHLRFLRFFGPFREGGRQRIKKAAAPALEATACLFTRSFKYLPSGPGSKQNILMGAQRSNREKPDTRIGPQAGFLTRIHPQKPLPIRLDSGIFCFQGP